jgi:hypothetical protein
MVRAQCECWVKMVLHMIKKPKSGLNAPIDDGQRVVAWRRQNRRHWQDHGGLVNAAALARRPCVHFGGCLSSSLEVV